MICRYTQFTQSSWSTVEFIDYTPSNCPPVARYHILQHLGIAQSCFSGREKCKILFSMWTTLQQKKNKGFEPKREPELSTRDSHSTCTPNHNVFVLLYHQTRMWRMYGIALHCTMPAYQGVKNVTSWYNYSYQSETPTGIMYALLHHWVLSRYMSLWGKIQ